jgi:hypothetical protein
MTTDRDSILDTITSPASGNVPARSGPPAWLAPAGLVLLSLVPIAAGAARLTELTSWPSAAGHEDGSSAVVGRCGHIAMTPGDRGM